MFMCRTQNLDSAAKESSGSHFSSRSLMLLLVVSLCSVLSSCDDFDERAASLERGEFPAGLKSIVVANSHGPVSLEVVPGDFGWSWEVEVRAGSQEDARHFLKDARSIGVSRGRAQLTLTLPFNSQCRFSSKLKLRIPRGCSAAIENRHGDTRVVGLDGDCRLTVQHGDIRLSGVRGNVDVKQSHGAFRAQETRGDLLLASAHTRVDVHGLEGNLKLSASHGRLRLDSLKGQASIDTHFGDLSLNGFEGAVISARHSDLQIDGGRGKLKVNHCAHGDIRLRSDARDIELQASHGDIRITLTGLSTRSIVARTSYDDISVDLDPQCRFTLRGTGENIRVFGRRHRGSVELRDPHPDLRLDLNSGRHGSISLRKRRSTSSRGR